MLILGTVDFGLPGHGRRRDLYFLREINWEDRDWLISLTFWEHWRFVLFKTILISAVICRAPNRRHLSTNKLILCRLFHHASGHSRRNVLKSSAIIFGWVDILRCHRWFWLLSFRLIAFWDPRMIANNTSSASGIGRSNGRISHGLSFIPRWFDSGRGRLFTVPLMELLDDSNMQTPEQ